MSRHHKLFLILTDLILIAASFFLALLIRFEGVLTPQFLEGRSLFYAVSFLFILTIFYLFGLYRKVWRYAGVHELVTIFNAVTVAMIPVGAIVFYSGGRIYPRSCIIIAWLLAIFLTGGIRFILRLISEKTAQPRISLQKRTLIVGADDPGEIILRELQRYSGSGYLCVGFIDEDKAKRNVRIHGVPVLGPRQELPYLIDHLKVDEIIIPALEPAILREIVSLCEKKPVKLKVVPKISEIIDGRVSVSQIREVQIEDLLDREVTDLDLSETASYLKDKRVLVTGAGGSIGAEICRQVAKFEPAQLILLGHGENSLYETEIELKNQTSIPLKIFIGDIRNFNRIEYLFKEYKPEVVFHAAAHKHVHLMEGHVTEAISNNLFGTINLVKLAYQNKIERFVFLSSDKAVNPVGIMGASKRLAEIAIQVFSENCQTKFTIVRFGNVLDSKGSVVPTFKRQIALGGPVTVTHPEMVRFFMTIPEAVQLVIQSALLGQGGEIFILDMGKPMRIMDVAKNMIKLSGFEPDIDIPIKIIGIRKGEKIQEELINLGENCKPTKIKKIFQVTKSDSIDSNVFKAKLEELQELVNINKDNEIRRIVFKMIGTEKRGQATF